MALGQLFPGVCVCLVEVPAGHAAATTAPPQPLHSEQDLGHCHQEGLQVPLLSPTPGQGRHAAPRAGEHQLRRWQAGSSAALGRLSRPLPPHGTDAPRLAILASVHGG